jgi:predicted nucleic acid-binding Zn ribbon protein
MPTPASPGTDQYRCNACGRYFNTAQDLSDHAAECRVAKEATGAGAEQLREQDSRPHLPNDQESKEHPFQHGTRR